MAKVPAAYRATQGFILDVDRNFYARLTAPEARTRIRQLVVPIREGLAWEVPADHVLRLSTLEGPQVGDLNLWSLHNPRERFWASRIRQLQRAHVSTFDRLWSTLPYLRPMATIIDDTLAGYGVDDDDQYFMKACPAREGDHLELFAEIDLLCALSCCPGGDLSVDLWGPNARDPLATCHPIGVEVYRLDPLLLEGWQPPGYAPYRGRHGLHGPAIDWAAEKRRRFGSA